MNLSRLNSLGERVRRYLSERLESVLQKRSGFKLLPIVGNGLSRLARGEAPSWDEWIRRAFVLVGEQPERFDSLKRQGFEHPEILQYIFQRAAELSKTSPGIEEDSWRWFGQKLFDLQPSNIHMALALMADRHVATTNYDDLLELAAFSVHRYSAKYVLKPLNLGPHILPSPFPPSTEDLVIWKLHGSLPIPNSDGRRNPAEFERWIREKSYEQLVATSSVYRNAALVGDTRPFLHLQPQFDYDDSLCLFVGASLTSAELVLMRMLYNRWGGGGNLVTLNVHRPADQQIRFRELGIQTVDLPLGLAANTWRRKLADIILLELLLERISIHPSKKTEAQKFLAAAYDELPVNALLQVSFANVFPVVGCVGPLQTTRLIGLSDPMQQEAFHSPAMATRIPDPAEAETLISDASLGQVGNPVLVWDALGLPSAVIAEIGDDARELYP